MDWQNAIFAPGWVWSMLSMVLVVGTLVGLYRQLLSQHTQMQEDTKLLRSQAHHNALTLSQRARELLIENEGFARIVNVGYAAPDALSDLEWARCSLYIVPSGQPVGVPLLPASRRFDPDRVLGGRRGLLQEHGRWQTGVRPLLVGQQVIVRRTLPLLRGSGVHQGACADTGPLGGGPYRWGGLGLTGGDPVSANLTTSHVARRRYGARRRQLPGCA